MKRVIIAFAVLLAFASFGGGARADNPTARKACTDAMNADPKFAEEIVASTDAAKRDNADVEIAQLHQDAADKVARNEQHVILAYAAMWIAAAVFLGFLWKRQRALKDQIARLSADLEKALAEDQKTAKTS